MVNILFIPVHVNILQTYVCICLIHGWMYGKLLDIENFGNIIKLLFDYELIIHTQVDR